MGQTGHGGRPRAPGAAGLIPPMLREIPHRVLGAPVSDARGGRAAAGWAAPSHNPCIRVPARGRGLAFLSPARCPPSPESPLSTRAQGMWPVHQAPAISVHPELLERPLAFTFMKVRKIPRSAKRGKAKWNVKPLDVLLPKVAPAGMQTWLSRQLGCRSEWPWRWRGVGLGPSTVTHPRRGSPGRGLRALPAEGPPSLELEREGLPSH